MALYILFLSVKYNCQAVGSMYFNGGVMLFPANGLLLKYFTPPSNICKMNYGLQISRKCQSMPRGQEITHHTSMAMEFFNNHTDAGLICFLFLIFFYVNYSPGNSDFDSSISLGINFKSFNQHWINLLMEKE